MGQFTHDVRNGLNALELQLTYLGEISTEPEVVEEVKRLRATLADVTRQIQAVRRATSAVMPNVMDYPASELFEDLRERLERTHAEAASKVRWNMTAAPTTVLSVDPDLTIQCLVELFINAFHFGEAASIRGTTADDADGMAFVLEERPAEAPAIATEHWGEPLLSSRRGAYGLGLFRVRRLVEAQGGALTTVYSPDDRTLVTKMVLPLGKTDA